MHISAGRLLFAHGYPRGCRANFGVFSTPESAGAGTGAQNRAEYPGPGPSMPQELVIFYRMRPIVPVFRPKSSMQVPSAAEYSQKCTPHPTPRTRSKKTNSLSLPSCRRRPRGLRWGRLQPRLFVAEADAQRLGLAHQIALGVDILELAGDILERHVAHLAVAQGNHVAKLAA